MGRYVNTARLQETGVSVIKSDYTVEPNETVLVDSTDGSFTLTIPDSTIFKRYDSVQIIDVGNALRDNPITISSNTWKFKDPASDHDTLKFDLSGTIITLIAYDNPGLPLMAVAG